MFQLTRRITGPGDRQARVRDRRTLSTMTEECRDADLDVL